MNLKRVLNYIGSMVVLEGIFMILPLFVAILYQENVGKIFLMCSILLVIIGLLIQKANKSDDKFYSAEGFVTVSLGWIVLSICGAMPFVASGEIPNFVDAVFETVSGYTTTGATILSDVTSLSKCMNFWRSFTHFVGGMGVLVLVLALLPTNSENLLIMRAESPGPQVGKLVPKVRETARTLYIIYIVITIIAIILYIISGMPIYDAICIGMGTAGTGGFVVTANGCADYGIVSQVLIGFFMILFGVNFNLYYLITIKKLKVAIKSEELRVYVGILFAAILLITINIINVIHSTSMSLHYAFFQSASIMTTTGFAICDYTHWPMLSRCILLFLMIVGGCAGSTAGGFKVSRVIISFKAMLNEIYLQLHPNSVKVVKFEERHVPSSIIRNVMIYTLIYVIITLLGVILISFDNFDFETTVSSVFETFNNIGLGLSKVGPKGNFSIFTARSKIIFILLMLTGRLEIFPMLLLFSKKTWRRAA